MALVNVRRPSSLYDKDENPCLGSMCLSRNSWIRGTSIDVNESYFTIKGAAVILSHSQQSPCPQNIRTDFLRHEIDEIELHLQKMLSLLRPQDTLTMAVRLQRQNKHPNHARYLAIVTCTERVKESALIGFDCFGDQISIGLTVPLPASTNIELDGDGGIIVDLSSSLYVFKPVSLQALWLAFQNLHKELRRVSNCLTGAPSYHNWLIFYQNSALATSDDYLCSSWQTSIIDEAARDDLKATVVCNSESRSPAEMEDEAIISAKLRQIMETEDLDEVTSRDVRKRLEDECNVCLPNYKEFIDRTMLFILGQMEKPSKIFDYLYLGTEWNAANFEELQRNNVRFILNVTKEVDCFFPSHFEYLKLFVTDDAATNLIRIWQKTFSFIKLVKEKNSVLLVHCKKGISRSASVVIAYAIKEYGMELDEAIDFVKQRRNCITPNAGFLDQLKTFAGMLNASSNRRSFFSA